MTAAAFALIAAALAAAWWGTGVYIRYALKHGIVDVPNHRSMHTRVTARGGGVVIVFTVLASTLVLAAAGALAWRTAAALLVGGALVAGIGWRDDRGGVSTRARALVHFLAAGIAVWLLGGLPTLRLGTFTVTLGLAGAVISVLAVVWLINLFNFMDGIDGIAAGEALAVALVGGVLLALGGHIGLAVASLVAAAACGGFLRWNWAPARVFMGDVASGFLGFLFAVLALASERAGAVPIIAWLVLGGVFLVDATLTLVRRVAHGERWYAAHRSHAYQRASRARGSHAVVSGAVMALNAVLAALAATGTLVPRLLLPAAAVALLLLVAVYLLVGRMEPMYPRAAASDRSTRTDPTPLA